ncbi:MAG: BMP family ABC transporter substrate-binding protein [Ilumatobacter sp.]|uniref:BMP family ABC transporter substrate-binding protein n=3 Tax=Ilumatobacter sp. TaxID=1967498 RepID=UPI00329A6F8E
MIKSKQMLAFGVVAALGLVACGSDSDSDTETDTTEAEAETDTTEAAGDTTATTEAAGDDAPSGDAISVGLTYDIGGRGDQSFNDSAFAGIERAEAELGTAYTDLVPNDDGSDRGELLQLQADENALVIGVGFLFADEVVEAAGNNPDTMFAVVDDAMLDEEGNPRCENCAGLTFAEEQGSFLVGAAAALQSETGTIGFLGGVSGFGLIEKFEAGFQAGALAVNPDIEIVAQYITAAPDFDGFTAPDRAREIALSMYADGADVVYHAAGGSGSGLFEAAKEQSDSSGTKVWAIGVDSDQYNTTDPELQEFILTSMLKRVDNAVFEITAAANDGSFAAGQTVYDLSVDGVGYSTSGGFVDAYVDQLEEFKAQIIDGTIEVPTEPS